MRPAAAAEAVLAPAPPLPDAPLRAPLDTLRVTGGFGESRSNHFHAGFDFSTGGRVGRPVRAPLGGWIERARASGVGYGRSLYLRADDGRLLVFGHLDAFAPALAACLDSAQRANGRYEQDLWPAASRFRFRAGDTLAWSGQSGAGGPHLHVEIRHGDFAIHPLRAGLVLPAPAAPRLVSLTLEPLDDRSRVAGGVWPLTFPLHARPETLEVEGRVRAIVRSASGVPGAGDSPAWSTSLEWAGESVEARLDSISWAGEMSELDELMDRGRVTGSGGLVLWSPAGWRPRFLRTSAPLAESAGVIEVGRGAPPRTMRLVALEPAGQSVERIVVLRPPGAGTIASRSPANKKHVAAPDWSFAALPGGRLRVRVTGAPAGLSSVRIACARDSATARTAGWDGGGWVAVLGPLALPDSAGLRIEGQLGDGKSWSDRLPAQLWPAGGTTDVTPAPGVRLVVAERQVFERGVLVVRTAPNVDAPKQGLRAAGGRVRVSPESLPLKRSVSVSLPVGKSLGGKRLAIYRRRGAGDWEWTGASGDPARGVLSAESSALGEFALMRDVQVPTLRASVPSRTAPKGPYSRWQLVAHARDAGSGIDGSESAFVVDGVRVPTEWDAESGVLRWRPLTPPAPGHHAYELRAVDRAGNAATIHGTFVLDSASR